MSKPAGTPENGNQTRRASVKTDPDSDNKRTHHETAGVLPAGTALELRHPPSLVPDRSPEVFDQSISQLSPSIMSTQQVREVVARLGAGESCGDEFTVLDWIAPAFPPLVTEASITAPGDSFARVQRVETFLRERKALQAADGKLAADALSDCTLGTRARETRRDGSSVEVCPSAAPLLAPDGSVTEICAIARALRETTKASSVLAESEYRFRRVFEASPVGKTLVNRDGRIVEANAAFATMLGYQPGDLVGKMITDITHPEDRYSTMESYAELFTAEVDSYCLEKRYLTRDGSVRWGRVTSVVLRDRKGEPELGLGIIQDVTHQVETTLTLGEREEHLRMALESASMWTFDRNLRTGHHKRWGPILESFPLQAEGDSEEFLALVHPDDRHLLTPGSLTASDDFVTNFRLRSNRGEYRWIQRRGRVVRDEAGCPVRVMGTGMDVTSERQAECRRAEAEAALSRVIEASPDAFVSLDSRYVVTGWNRAAQEISGWSPEEAIGRPVSELMDIPGERERVRALLRRTAAKARSEGCTLGPIEMTITHRNGQSVPVEASWVFTPVASGSHMSVFVRDIRERKATQAELERLALTDALTGLPNRALIQDRLHGALARLSRHGGQVGVLFLDLDRFKVVNDSLGHDAGDELLRASARRVTAALRPGDTLGRFGGDEFMILAEDTAGVSDLVGIAKRVLVAISEPLSLGGYQITPSASIGIAVGEDAATTVEDLVRGADLAMYRAKGRGGGAYEIFGPEMRHRAMERLANEGELRQAITRGDLKVHYQPYVSVDGRLSGVEALVRWAHPTRGLVGPAEFIALAEETGLIVPMGEWVLGEACRQVAAWRSESKVDLELSVNLSARQLAQPGLPALVREILASTGLEPSGLCLEITETALMSDPDSAARSLRELRRLGVRVAVDDFGTGYSSLLYLRRFPVQVLKLDRCFVEGVCRNLEDAVIIGSIIDLAHALGLTAIAEGVETAEQLRALEALGCDLIQGHYWSAALDADRMTAKLHEGPSLLPAC